MKWALLLVLGLCCTGCQGCAIKYEVRSNTCWTGNVNQASVSGCGDKTYDTQKGCAVFQMNTESGTLSARAKNGVDSDWITTTAPYGVVTVCAGN